MEERIPGLLVLLLLSTACVPQQVLTEHRGAMLEISTNGICRYGNRVDCCWGWTPESWGQCRPVCESGCKHGECVGPDQCRCHQGYMGKTCNQDVNECGLKPRPCKHRCVNLVGSYKCFCLTGYMITHDGTCRNTRTCAMANCQYGCAVMKGEVMCQCPSPGLRLGPDRRTCVDIDECAMGVAKCPRFRKCVNTFSSYVCKCHRGYELRYINGKYQCTDKNNPCHENSQKCRCKPGTRGWGYDCKIVITVAVDPARPSTTRRPTTTITTATLPPTTSPPTTTKTSARTTTAMTTTTTTTTTMPTTVPTTTALTTGAMTTTTTTSATITPNTVPTTTTALTTVAMTTPTTTSATTTTTSGTTTTLLMTTTTTTTTPATVSTITVAMTTTPTTVTTTAPTTVAMPTEPTMVSTTTVPTTVIMTTTLTTVPTITTTMATTTLPTTTALSTTMQLITTTLDNHIREITQRPRGDVHIPRNPDQNVFELDFDDIELGNTADFARDDSAPGSLSCSFDQGVCSWMTDRDGDLRWEAISDPHGGRYLTVPEPKTGGEFRGARLSIPLAPPTFPPWKGGDLCLAFKHRLQGLLIGSLQVFVKKGWGYSPAVWTRTSGHGWRHTQLTLWGWGIESVVFKGEMRKGRSGEIAIDDVSIHTGVCSNTGRD